MPTECTSHPSSVPCWVEYLPVTALCNYLRARSGHVLGVVRFTESDVPAREQIPEAVIPLAQLGDTPKVEIWLSQLPVHYGHHEGLSYAKNEELLFGTYALPEAEHEPFEALTDRAYDTLLSLMRGEGYPHLMRIWNFFRAINAEQAGLERYRRFSLGRQTAFTRHGYAPPASLPAASAIGTHEGGLQIYFLATRTPALTIENPRQINAYRYPPRYGPYSPWFSRAVLKDWGSEWHLYISGTASIVGHESRNSGEPSTQLRETCRNLQALLETVAVKHRVQPLVLPSSVWKVYARGPKPTIMDLAEHLRAIGDQHLPILILAADLCRLELLIEVEGVLRFAK